MTEPRIQVPQDELARFCRAHHIKKLSLFGSILREDFDAESDVDVLVEFEPGHVPGLGFVSMESELSELLGRRVDLVTPKFLNRRIRDKVLESAVVQYAGS
ncbi:MAG: nucleotidyltransferase family protein [Thermoanaerobaculia bacterium]